VQQPHVDQMVFLACFRLQVYFGHFRDRPLQSWPTCLAQFLHLQILCTPVFCWESLVNCMQAAVFAAWARPLLVILYAIFLLAAWATALLFTCMLSENARFHSGQSIIVPHHCCQ
jgi:hypothetical protein